VSARSVSWSRLTLAVLACLHAVAVAQTRPVAVLRSSPPSSALERSLREMLGRLDVNLDTAVADGGAPALALIDVDLSTGRIVVDSPTLAMTIRREIAAGLSADLATETAATLVASSIEVLLHTDPPRQPVKPELAPVVTLTPAPPPVRLSPVGLDLGVGLGPRLLGGSAVVDVGASVHALLSIPLGLQLPGVLASVTFQPGFELTTDAISLRGSALLVRLFAQLEVVRWTYGRLEAGVGGGFDRFSFSPLAREGEVFRPMASRVVLAPIVSGLLAYRFPVGETVHLFASVTVDGDLRPPLPMRGQPQDPNDVRPWTVRPMLLIGVSFAPLRARE
jgi:hypothetical protein